MWIFTRKGGLWFFSLLALAGLALMLLGGCTAASSEPSPEPPPWETMTVQGFFWPAPQNAPLEGTACDVPYQIPVNMAVVNGQLVINGTVTPDGTPLLTTFQCGQEARTYWMGMAVNDGTRAGLLIVTPQLLDVRQLENRNYQYI